MNSCVLITADKLPATKLLPPIGTIFHWAGTLVPDGFYLCNGQTINYQGLPRQLPNTVNAVSVGSSVGADVTTAIPDLIPDAGRLALTGSIISTGNRYLGDDATPITLKGRRRLCTMRYGSVRGITANIGQRTVSLNGAGSAFEFADGVIRVTDSRDLVLGVASNGVDVILTDRVVGVWKLDRHMRLIYNDMAVLDGSDMNRLTVMPMAATSSIDPAHVWVNMAVRRPVDGTGQARTTAHVYLNDRRSGANPRACLAESGGDVVLSTCGGADAFQLTERGQLRNNKGVCVERSLTGSDVYYASCDDTRPQQQWLYNTTGDRQIHSGLARHECLAGDPSGSVWLENCNNSFNNQRWTQRDPFPNRPYGWEHRLRSRNGWDLNVEGNRNEHGTKIQQWPDSGQPFVYTLDEELKWGGRCLTAGDDNRVMLMDCSGRDNQKWTPNDLTRDFGGWQFVNKARGGCLRTSGGRRGDWIVTGACSGLETVWQWP